MNHGWDSFNSMFDNIGAKIKQLAKIISLCVFVAETIFGALAFFSAFQDFEDSWFLIFLGLIIILLSPLTAWLSAFALYAFGELVEKTAKTENYTKEIVKLLSQKDAPKKETEKPVGVKAAESAQYVPKQPKPADVVLPQVQSAPTEIVIPAKAKPIVVEKDRPLADKLKYALKYSTDEGMVSYLESLDDDLVKDILQAPAHSVRELVENALETLCPDA